MDNLKRVNIRISPQLHAFFKELSDETGVAASSWMVIALTQYADQQKALAAVPLLEQLMQSAEFRETLKLSK